MLKNWKNILFILLVILGILLRVWGFLYMGNHNYSSYREGAHRVRTKGLVEGYGGMYFPISMMIFVVNDYLGELTPSNWWWPYKASNFIFELAILSLLVYLFKKQRFKLLFMYWLNPWFLIPPAWAGFWDSAFVIFIVLAALILDSKISERNKIVLAGLTLTIPATMKPQVFAVILAMGVYFFVFQIWKKNFRNALIFFFLSFLSPLLFNIYFFIKGKSIIYFFKWYYVNTFWAMENLINSGINIWYTIVRVIQYFQGRSDPIYAITVFEFPYNILEYLAAFAFVGIIFLFVLRARDFYISKDQLPKLFFLKLFTLSLFILTQIFTRSHAYHFLTASLLLIILILKEKNNKLFLIWISSTAIHFYNIFRNYGLGPDIALPFTLWYEPFMTILGLVQFMITLWYINYTFNSIPAPSSAKTTNR